MEQTVFVDSTGQSHVLNLRFHRESRTKYRAKSVDDVLDSVRYALYSDYVVNSTERASYDDLIDMFS